MPDTRLTVFQFVLRNNGELAEGSGLLVSPSLARLLPGLAPTLQQPPADLKDYYFVQFLLNAQERLNRGVTRCHKSVEC